jgi:hypothetical protein
MRTLRDACKFERIDASFYVYRDGRGWWHLCERVESEEGIEELESESFASKAEAVAMYREMCRS